MMPVRIRGDVWLGVATGLAALALPGGGQAKPAARPAPAEAVLATAPLIAPDGAPAGKAWLVRGPQGLGLRLALTGLPPGVHGLHLHTKGLCVGPDFASAGGHLNPGHRQHGADNPMGAHMGDLPNVTADAQGRVATTLPLAGEVDALLPALFDADGTALVVHAQPDDYKTDPAGNAGPRIACGVFGQGS